MMRNLVVCLVVLLSCLLLLAAECDNEGGLLDEVPIDGGSAEEAPDDCDFVIDYGDGGICGYY